MRQPCTRLPNASTSPSPRPQSCWRISRRHSGSFCSSAMRAAPLGREVVLYARQAQAGLDRFLADLEIKQRGGHGHLVFGAIMGAAPDIVARAVAEIKRERPRLKVRIVGETSDQIGELLEHRAIEL